MFHTLSIALFMPPNVLATADFMRSKTPVTVSFTQFTAVDAAVLMPSHTPEMTLRIPFQMEDTVLRTAVKTVVTMVITMVI